MQTTDENGNIIYTPEVTDEVVEVAPVEAELAPEAVVIEEVVEAPVEEVTTE